MTVAFRVVVAGLALGALCLTALAAGKRPIGQWSYFHFDGGAFIAGRPTNGAPFVAVRPGTRPVVATHAAKLEALSLAPGTGAVVGICYVHSSGGKLGPAASYLPVAQMPVKIYAGDTLVVTTQTDEQGYFIATLMAGSYLVSSKETVEVTVEDGTTTLLPLRVGKRMVD